MPPAGETVRPSIVIVCEVIPPILADAPQVITSISVGSSVPSLGAASSATTTPPITSGGTNVAVTSNVLEYVELMPLLFVAVIE